MGMERGRWRMGKLLGRNGLFREVLQNISNI